MLNILKECLSELFYISPEDVTPEASLNRDLGLTSLDLMKLKETLEEKHRFYLPAGEILADETVEDLLKSLRPYESLL